LAPGLALGLASGFTPELQTGFEFRFIQLSLGLELAARLAAVLGLDGELIFASLMFASRIFASRIGIDTAPGFTLTVALGFAPAFASDVEVVAGRDGPGGSSGADLDMDVASLAPKLAGTDDAGMNDGGQVAVEAAGVAAGMEIASTRIAVPRVRLHSTRQWREVRRRLGNRAAMVAFSETYKNATGDEEESRTERKADAARVAGYSPANQAMQLRDSIVVIQLRRCQRCSK
jgi:hypothetical protein